MGICFAGVWKLVDSEQEDYCGMNKMLYLTWMGMAARKKVEREFDRQIVVNKYLDELKKL